MNFIRKLSMKKLIITTLLMSCFSNSFCSEKSCTENNIYRYREELDLEGIQKCIDDGNAFAKYVGSYFYSIGIKHSPMEKNLPLSLKLAHEAAQAGNRNSLLLLSRLYEIGEATKRNLNKSRYYLKKCAASGPDSYYCNCREELSRLSIPTAKPLGMEIGVATIKDVTEKFPQAQKAVKLNEIKAIVTGAGLYAVHYDNIYTLESKYTTLTTPNNSKIYFIFGKDQILDYVIAHFYKHEFDYLQTQLKQKYNLRIDGNYQNSEHRDILFDAGDSFITLTNCAIRNATTIKYQSARYYFKERAAIKSLALSERYTQQQNL